MIFTANVNDFSEWRKKAREFLIQAILPEKILWQSVGLPQTDLFAEATVSSEAKSSSHLLQIADIVSCHRDTGKWQLLYQIVWRIIHGEKNY